MIRLTQQAGGLSVETGSYVLFFPTDRPYAMLDVQGSRWAELFLGSSLHTKEGLDETARFFPAQAEQIQGGVEITVKSISSHWREKRLLFRCRAQSLDVSVQVQGDGSLTDVHLFGGYYSGHLRWGSGFFQSGAKFRSLFNPEPSGPERRTIPAGESTVIDVMGTSVPGKLHWFFTPAPFLYAVSMAGVSVGAGSDVAGASGGADQGGTPVAQGPTAVLSTAPAPVDESADLPNGPWLSMGLAVPPGQHNFSGFHYDGSEGAFSLRLPYEGQTAVDGRFETPAVLFQFGAPDPYTAITQYVTHLTDTGLVHLKDNSQRPAWWSEPIQCGWGAQCHLSNVAKIGKAPDYCRQEHYDTFLTALEAQGLKPGTVVLDDKWSGAYATCEVDPDKWPDLKGWAAKRHQAGQRVLLWWKAWDPEGLPVDQCVRNFAGMPVGADPSNPDYEATLRKAVRLMLGKDGYDADGFKIDFSARTPSGPGLIRHGKEWGVELLFKLLWILYDEAKKVKPDALVMTHTPNPYFAQVTDMIRLNDVNTGRPVVPQMRHRALVAKAACPNLLIDTDNWPMPSRAAWRDYLQAQNELGIPSLYFATDLDCMEPLEAADYAALRRVWAEHRARGY